MNELFFTMFKEEPSRLIAELEKASSLLITNDEGISLMQVAFNSGNQEVFHWLLKKGAPFTADGSTFLMYSVIEGEPELIEKIIEMGHPLNNQNEEGETVLMWASAMGRLDVVEILLAHAVDASITNKEGLTALDIASSEGEQEIASLLREYIS